MNKIKCPECGNKLSEINIGTMAWCFVEYNEKTEEFNSISVDPCAIEELKCECMQCGHEWEWEYGIEFSKVVKKY